MPTIYADHSALLVATWDSWGLLRGRQNTARGSLHKESENLDVAPAGELLAKVEQRLAHDLRSAGAGVADRRQPRYQSFEPLVRVPVEVDRVHASLIFALSGDRHVGSLAGKRLVAALSDQSAARRFELWSPPVGRTFVVGHRRSATAIGVHRPRTSKVANLGLISHRAITVVPTNGNDVPVERALRELPSRVRRALREFEATGRLGEAAATDAARLYRRPRPRPGAPLRYAPMAAFGALDVACGRGGQPLPRGQSM